MNKKHQYNIELKWTGNNGLGTRNYSSYERDFEIETIGKPKLFGSSDPAFRGDRTKYNPEDMLLNAISSCHMLWYLHLCSNEGIIVIDYKDNATATMIETENGSGNFEDAILNPIVVITDKSKKKLAIQLHCKANEMCFIANSLNFQVKHFPTIIIQANV
ncbi:MAG: OsmC family protein [Limnohabitans sp.]|nr:OsmC family protein [Limnohabitans sp.]MDI9311190.1 OsmC family protein [Limnohabitans sp.]